MKPIKLTVEQVFVGGKAILIAKSPMTRADFEEVKRRVDLANGQNPIVAPGMVKVR